MPTVSISEAARLAGKPRSTIHRHISNGKLSRQENALGKPVIDVAELERVYGGLKQPDMERTDAKLQAAPPRNDAVDREELAALRRETALLREQLDDLRTDRDHWRQQATALLTDQREKASKKPAEGLLSRWVGWSARKG